jgi:hypothetical protein
MDGIVTGFGESTADRRRERVVDQEPHSARRRGSSRSRTASDA